MVRRAISVALAPPVWKTLEDLCSTRPVPMAFASPPTSGVPLAALVADAGR